MTFAAVNDVRYVPSNVIVDMRHMKCDDLDNVAQSFGIIKS